MNDVSEAELQKQFKLNKKLFDTYKVLGLERKMGYLESN